MITIVLTYRNRDLGIVKRCFDSLKSQSNKDFKVVLVNYGSQEHYTKQLKGLVAKYAFLTLIQCDTQQELWSKSRAINIVLKHCDTDYMFVGDVDMIYHPKFIETLTGLKNAATTYFQVGFLSEEESQHEKAFEAYNISFISDEAATGMTLFKTEVLKSINGYDEFYHGWGSEDTDVHWRLKNAGHAVKFYNKNLLMLHQWHAKQYRSKESLEPFHAHLEQVNEAYLNFSNSIGKTIANESGKWGHYSEAEYKALHTVESEFSITNSLADVKGFINAVLLKLKNRIIKVEIKEHQEYKSLKQLVKGKIGKKTIPFLEMDAINDLVLESIINNLNGQAYSFVYNRKNQIINLTIKL